MNIMRQPALILVLVVLVLLLFGSRRLPDAARGIGESLRVFRREMREVHEPDGDGKAPPPASSAAPAAASGRDDEPVTGEDAGPSR